MLSNTATPKYYGMFRDDVIAGKIPVCKEMSMEMNRIDALIADPRFFYDDEAVEGWIDFCNSELTLTDGSDLNLLDSYLVGITLLSDRYMSRIRMVDPVGIILIK